MLGSIVPVYAETDAELKMQLEEILSLTPQSSPELAAAASAEPAPASAEEAAPEPSPVALQELLEEEQKANQELDGEVQVLKEMNELLKERIRALEAQLEKAGGVDLAASASVPAPEEQNGAKPELQAEDPETERALERALVRRGLAVMPPKVWELSPSFNWSHTGTNEIRTRRDSYVASLDARVGLPMGFMVGAGLPYIIKTDTIVGDNSGFSDVDFTVWKQFLAPSDNMPTIVGSLNYSAPTGEDPDSRIPIGSDFHSLRARLSVSKSLDPMSFSGGVFYGYTFEEELEGRRIQPGDQIGISGSASLAITPGITGSLGLSLSQGNKFKVDGEKRGTERTFGSLSLSAGFTLSRRTFLSIYSSFGVTDDSNDLSVGFAIPVRF